MNINMEVAVMRKNMIGVLACFLVLLSIVACSCSNIEEQEKEQGIIDNQDLNNISETIDPYAKDNVLSEDDVEERFTNATEILRASGGMGGGSYLFNREYQDITYNIAYLRKIYRNEISLLGEGVLDQWVNEVFLQQSEEEQNELPTMYQAIRDLNISKEDLIALNDNRKQYGDDMVLTDEYIDALYMSESEMKKVLVNPLALYYNGDIYTWEKLNESNSLSATSKVIPPQILSEYIEHVITYCEERGVITSSEVERYFGAKVSESYAEK
jgi:hypothetical protein